MRPRLHPEPCLKTPSPVRGARWHPNPPRQPPASSESRPPRRPQRQPQRRLLPSQHLQHRRGGLGRVALLGAVRGRQAVAGGARGAVVVGDAAFHRSQGGRGGEAGTEGARLDDQHLDPERRHLAGQRLARQLQGALGCGVRADAGERQHAAHARQLDDRAGAALAHLRQDQAGQLQGAEEHHFHRGAEFGLARLLDRADDAEAGIVHQDVDASRGLDRGAELRAVAHVEFDDGQASAGLAQPPRPSSPAGARRRPLRRRRPGRRGSGPGRSRCSLR